MRDIVLKVIYEAIDEVNADLETPVLKREDSSLFGVNSILDSMDLVHLITAIEQKLEDETGVYLSIADERAMSMQSSPFRTVEAMADYITKLINEQEK